MGRGSASRRRASPSRAPALVTAPSVDTVVLERNVAAKVGGRKTMHAWCRTLVTGRARGALTGERPAAARGSGAWGPGVEWGAMQRVSIDMEVVGGELS